MKQFKFWTITSLIFLLFSFFTHHALAADLDVTCGAGGCSSVGPEPLFYETDILPGWSVTKSVSAINNYAEDRYFAIETVNFDNTEGLGDVLNIVIKETGAVSNLYDDVLTNLDTLGYKILSEVTAGGSKDYDFIVSMLTAAGNEYQEKILTFDLNFGFEMTPVPTPTPSPSPGASPSPSPGPCTTPSAPTGLTATMVSSSVISLSWTASGGASHYAIAYGLSPGVYIYGASNVGNVTSYVVSGLSSGTTYYFVVYAVNDCGSSGASVEASATTAGVLGAFIAPGPAVGFEVLGEATPSAEKEEMPFYPGVAGEEISCFWWRYLWWLPLLVQAILSGGYAYWLRRRKERGEKIEWFYYLPLVLLAMLSQVIHWFLDCECVQSRWCPWYWLFNLIILVSSLVAARKT